MKKTYLLSLFSGLSFGFFAQWNITQVHLTSGSYRNFGDEPSKLSDFGALAPGSSILMKDLSQYQDGNYMYNFLRPYPGFGGSSNTSFQSLQLGLKLPWCSGTLRLGISNFRNNAMNAYLSNYESFVVDTLVSSQNGSMTFVDSTVQRNVYVNYSNQQLRLEAAYVWEKDAGKRWAFSAGAGISFGLSYQSKTTLLFNEYTNSYQGYGSGYQGNQTNTFERETYKNPMNWGANVYIPLGINFRLGTKRAFWMPWMIYTELRPQLAFQSIPKVGMKFSPGIGTSSGLRYNIPQGSKQARGHADFK
jgi:hypothetical protein